MKKKLKINIINKPKKLNYLQKQKTKNEKKTFSLYPKWALLMLFLSWLGKKGNTSSIFSKFGFGR